jgi:hypothetical protein
MLCVMASYVNAWEVPSFLLDSFRQLDQAIVNVHTGNTTMNETLFNGQVLRDDNATRSEIFGDQGTAVPTESPAPSPSPSSGPTLNPTITVSVDAVVHTIVIVVAVLLLLLKPTLLYATSTLLNVPQLLVLAFIWIHCNVQYEQPHAFSQRLPLQVLVLHSSPRKRCSGSKKHRRLIHVTIQ